MSVLGLHHAGLYVSDLERSIAFYSDAFGLELAERFAFGAEEIAFLKLGAARLELIEASGGQRRAGVVDHVAFEVDDLNAALERLREHGVVLLDQAPLDVPELQARIFFCLGPDAERIELFEYVL
ncbi:MAG TPA: VOC family protein [Chloroflexota bacterium]|nr:VOC family protein [Chloroflexota bacterium]